MSARAPVSRRRGIEAPAGNRPRVPWWLHPRFAVLFLGVPFVLIAYAVPESEYVSLFRTAKRIDLDFVVVALIVYAGFLLGSFFAVGTGTRPQERDVVAYCRWFVWPAFALTVLGYVIWFTNGVLNAGGVGSLVDVLVRLVAHPSPGFSDYVKLDLFQRIPGVTTLTQVGILYATVEALLWARGGSRRRLALLRAAVVTSLTLPRAVLLSERLALVEVAVPVAVVLLANLYSRGAYRNLIRLAPLYLAFGVFGLFAFGEYFRSWSYYKALYSGPYLWFAAERFAGYYTTAVNNAAVVYRYEPLHPLRHTLSSLFDFPVLGDAVGRSYAAVFGDDHDYESTQRLLEIYANPEFNNIPLIGLLPNEYTVYLAPVAAFFLGFVSVSLYRSFVKGRLLGVLAYPSWFVGLLEISRVYFWPSGRYFPVLAFLALSLFLFRMAKVPARTPPGRSRARRAGVTVGTREA